MTVIKRNAVANLAGRVWSNLLAFAFVPVYLHFLGVEAYGLVGFAATLQSILILLDVGFGAAMLRELARLSAIPGSAREQRDTVRTLELIYAGIAFAGGSAVAFLAPLIATRWVHPQHLSIHAVTTSIRIIGLMMAMQYLYVLYEVALMALQRQVFVNVILAVSGTVRAGLSVLVLWLFSRTIEAFMLTQALTWVAAMVVMRIAIWRAIPRVEERAAFRLSIVSLLWKYAAGTFGIALTTAIFYQVDKVLFSRLLTLTVFGYYMIAQSVGGVLWSVVRPISTAVFPRFSQLVVLDDQSELRTLYHGGAQAMSTLVVPAGVMLMFFSYDVILVWTHDAIVAANAAPIAAFVAAGIMAIGLADMPLYLRLAHGWVSLSLKTNLILLAVMLPVLLFAIVRYGAIGGACAWAAVHVANLLITAPLTHRRLLRGAFSAWAINDTFIPLGAAVIVAALARMAIPREGPLLLHFAQLAAAGLLIFSATALSAPIVRRYGFTYVRAMLTTPALRYKGEHR